MATTVGIISDTHGLLREEVREVLTQCDVILHAGDVTDDDILDEIRFLGSLYVVRGNCDRGVWADFLKDRLRFHIEDLEFLMVHNRAYAGELISEADVVVYGHSHKYSESTDGEGRLWLNPGTCGYPRHNGEVTMAVMTIEGKEYTIDRIDFA